MNSRPKPPKRPREEIVASILDRLKNETPEQQLNFLLGFFTAVDLEMIDAQLEAEK
jgi:hypothetical protein